MSSTRILLDESYSSGSNYKLLCNTNQKAINTKTRGHPPLSKPEKLRRAAESMARKETLRDVNRLIDNTNE